jgi:hypothetical protein
MMGLLNLFSVLVMISVWQAKQPLFQFSPQKAAKIAKNRQLSY